MPFEGCPPHGCHGAALSPDLPPCPHAPLAFASMDCDIAPPAWLSEEQGLQKQTNRATDDSSN